ncbi:unnamed protein product, partial [Iphiclides podalirius]
MDCFKDFLGNDYEAHIKCVTEEERYSGKGFTAKEKKGEKKQNAWVEMLQSVLDEAKSASPNVIRIIETISKHNNTPRKKPKFINFVKNVCGQKTNIKDIDEAWDLISVKLSELSNLNSQNKNQNQKNGTSETNGLTDKLENGDKKEKDIEEDSVKNVTSSEINGDRDNSEKKMSKKQRKEEKKKKKYEAELHSAEQQPSEEEADDTQSKKKGKKNKNKVNDTDGIENGVQTEGKNKNKKRKRQDTVNTVPEIVDNVIENDIENEDTNKIKVQQKKPKVQPEEVSLHDQNVAKSDESVIQTEKFNWHAVIISVLQKKDNEVPFKRLQKKVLGEYQEITGNEVDDRIAEKFIKKLKSAPNVRVDKNRVMLIEEN